MKVSTIKFHENLSSGSRDGRTDWHDEASILNKRGGLSSSGSG
jgi:hypothetical protein